MTPTPARRRSPTPGPPSAARSPTRTPRTRPSPATRPALATVGLAVGDGDADATCAAAATAQVNCTVAAEDAGHLRGRRLPQPHHLLGRLDLDAEAGQEGDRQGRHALGPRLVRAGRPRRQRQPQLHAGRRRDARHAGLPVRRQAQGPTTTWENSGVDLKGDVSGTAPNRNMWRWQSIQEFQYPLIEYLSALKNLPLFLGIEIGGRRPRAHLDVGHHRPDPGGARHRDAADRRRATRRSATPPRSRSGSTASTAATPTPAAARRNNWDCSVPGSANAADPSWNATAQKLIPAGGAGTGTAATRRRSKA